MLWRDLNLDSDNHSIKVNQYDLRGARVYVSSLVGGVYTAGIVGASRRGVTGRGTGYILL